MTDRSAADSTSRQIAQREFDRPVAVEAGAGTGKTTVLVSRVLAWSLDRGWLKAENEISESRSSSEADSRSVDDLVARRVMSGVVAITFTDAAAAQMATRISESLAQLAARPAKKIVGFDQELLEGTTDPEILAGRALALVGALDHLRVRTIHSFCWNLLTSYPISARVAPDLKVDADGRQLEIVARQVVEEATKEAYSEPNAHPLGRLALRRIDPNLMAEAVQTLVSDGVRAEAFDRDPLSDEECRAFARRMQARLETASELMSDFSGSSRAKNAVKIVRAVEESLEQSRVVSDNPNRSQVTRFLSDLDQIWDDGLLGHLKKWSGSKLNKTETELIGDRRTELATIASDLEAALDLYRRADWELLQDARRALAPLLLSVEENLRSRGYATFSSLLTETWHLLASRPGVRRRERRRIDQLLVDEFQDTDRVQSELIRLLALDGEPEERPGLFVVGDPKQSIYGWRNADLAAYDEFGEALEAANGLFISLDRNFRSVPAVLEEVDRSIRPIMKREAGVQPGFRSLVPAIRKDSDPLPEDVAAVEYWISWRNNAEGGRPGGAETHADDAAQIEARAIASDIVHLVQRHRTAWNSFALLLRSTSRLETYLDVFRQARVPFVVTSDKHYYRRREIIDIAALVRTIINPVDHVALVTFLRSPAVGVPDAALLPLWRRRFPALATELTDLDDGTMTELRAIITDVAKAIPEEIPGIDRIPRWGVSLISALENLTVLRRSFAIDPADRFIELLRHLFMSEVTEAARYLGIYRLANLDRFFRGLESSLEERSGDAQAVLRMLRRSVSEIEETEQALPEGATESGVQIMTIHRAKGLEFDHVYLAQTHARGRDSKSSNIRFDRRWLPGESAQYALFGSPTLGFDSILARDRQIDSAERVRTLYVAMTRAKKRLVMLGKWPAVPIQSASGNQVTYLDLLGRRETLPLSFEALLSDCVENNRTFVDIETTRWRFPGLENDIGSGQPSEETPHLPLDIAKLGAAANHLRHLGIDAEQRMRLPFSTTASDEAITHLEPLIAKSGGQDQGTSPPGTGRLVGTSFHRIMETWRLDTDPDLELERQRAIQLDWLTRNATPSQRQIASQQLEALLGRFHNGEIWHRFLGSAEEILARELPVVLPPAHSSQQPTGFVSGSIDLILRDSDHDRLVIVDYKTDRVEDNDELELRAAAYAHQESVYARAVAESLGLERLPACQLWFIWPDRLWENRTQESL